MIGQLQEPPHTTHQFLWTYPVRVRKHSTPLIFMTPKSLKYILDRSTPLTNDWTAGAARGPWTASSDFSSWTWRETSFPAACSRRGCRGLRVGFGIVRRKKVQHDHMNRCYNVLMIEGHAVIHECLGHEALPAATPCCRDWKEFISDSLQLKGGVPWVRTWLNQSNLRFFGPLQISIRRKTPSATSSG
jgi:hypothetical protein